jgi:hypothetical protein
MPRKVSKVFAAIWSMMSCVGPIVTTDPTRKFDGAILYVLSVDAAISSVAIALYGLPDVSESLIHA